MFLPVHLGDFIVVVFKLLLRLVSHLQLSAQSSKSVVELFELVQDSFLILIKLSIVLCSLLMSMRNPDSILVESVTFREYLGCLSAKDLVELSQV
jgi:hypothetical protein